MSWAAVTARLGVVAGLGLILTALSELAFYPVDLAPGALPDLAVMVLAYGLCGWLAWGMVGGRDGAAATWVMGGAVGFLAEGVVVPQLYAELPLSLVWTPLAWHAAVSVAAGLAGLGWALARGAAAAALAAGLLGVAVGLWSAWMWRVVEAPDGTQTFADADPWRLALQMTAAGMMLVAGHAIWRAGAPRPRPSRWDVALPGALFLL